MDLLRGVLRGDTLIPIVPASEPGDFDRKVRKPGQAFLRTTPHPIGSEWDDNNYWSRSIADLQTSYNSICAYCGSWTNSSGNHHAPSYRSVDHFVPKSVSPTQAYDWDNFRLCRTRLNIRKGNHQDVLDPFTLAPGWFHLSFLTFLVAPDSTLSLKEKNSVLATIDRLQLNIDQDYVNERVGAIREYCLGIATKPQLGKHFPFITTEMDRQDFDINFLPRLRPFFTAQL